MFCSVFVLWFCYVISNQASEPNWDTTGANRRYKTEILPSYRISFFCPTFSWGNLHVLLSSSVWLILPLILHCPHVKSKAHTQTDPGQQSCGYQSMKWKNKTTPSLSHCPQPSLCESAQHLMELIKWLISYQGWSVDQGSYNAVERRSRFTEVCLHFNCNW